MDSGVKSLFFSPTLRHDCALFVETSHGRRALRGSRNMKRACSEHGYSVPHRTGSRINMTSCMTSHMIQCRGLGRFMFHILLLNKPWAPRKTSAGNLERPSRQPRRASRTAAAAASACERKQERRPPHHKGQESGQIPMLLPETQ